jgi:short-subunit dehydrogenase
MNLDSARALVTGGAGGIGQAIASELLRSGTHVLLVDRDRDALNRVRETLRPYAHHLDTLAIDLTNAGERTRLCEMARGWRGGVDILINNAGVNHFGLFDEQSPEQIELAIAVNVSAPLHLCRELLPHLKSRQHACILNTGSVFGAIGFPGYTTYSATKFAMRGFSEALRRELAATAVRVHYLAPRATRTSINPPAVERMNAELGVAMDPPSRVARAAVALISRNGRAAVIGFPEKLFVRINALFPALVDRAMRRQLPVIERHARRSAAAPAAAELSDLRRHAS